MKIEKHVLKLDPTTRINNVAERIKHLQQIVDKRTDSEDTSRALLKEVERECHRILGETKAWRELKQSGRSGLPKELALKFDRLYEICGEKGLFINPAGDLESMLFDYSVDHSTDKSAWFQTAIGLIGNLEVDLSKQPWTILNNILHSLL
jgi:hypothetical protein